MTVGELLAQLELLDPDLTVVLSADEEGNAFESLRELGYGWFNTRHREYRDDEDEDYDPAEDPQAAKAVSLWP